MTRKAVLQLAARLTILIIGVASVVVSTPSFRGEDQARSSRAYESLPEAVPAAARSHNAALPNMVTWNMCNGDCDSGASSAGALVGALGNNPVPVTALTTQEICIPTWLDLKQFFTAYGWQARKIDMYEQGGVCDRRVVGVFWLGECFDAPNCVTREFYANQGPMDPFDRGVLCGRAAFPSFNFCGTHLSNSPTWAGYQADLELAALAVYYNASVPTFVAGDFNIRDPWSVRLDDFYNAWDEADGCRSAVCWRFTFVPRSNPDDPRKVDYLFAPSATHCVAHDAQLIDKAESDHHLMRGYQGLRPC